MPYWIDTIRRDRLARRPGLRRSLAVLMIAAGDILLTWRERCSQRRQLARLDPRLLKDIGVSRAEALREARKPFWRG